MTELLSAGGQMSTDSMETSISPLVQQTSNTGCTLSQISATPLKVKIKGIYAWFWDGITILNISCMTSLLIGTQTETNTRHIEQNSVATQCNLLDAPPLELLKPGFSLDDLFVTETEPEKTNLDASFCLSQEESATE